MDQAGPDPRLSSLNPVSDLTFRLNKVGIISTLQKRY